MRYDAQSLMQAFPVREVLARFGAADLRHAGGRWRGPCPVCRTSDASQAFAVRDREPGRWRCFACGQHGDSIDLWAALSGSTPGAALRDMASAAGLSPIKPGPAADRARLARGITRTLDQARRGHERRRLNALADDARRYERAAESLREAAGAFWRAGMIEAAHDAAREAASAQERADAADRALGYD